MAAVAMDRPSDGFLLLAATLLEALPTGDPVSDTALMQLHALFGPMLMSALQLIDKREVVMVKLPGGRRLYQVTSSTGRPYTLPIHLPPPLPPPPPAASATTAMVIDDHRSPSPTPVNGEPVAPSTPPGQVVRPAATASADIEAAEAQREEARLRARRVYELAGSIRGMYCPCAGYMFNTLGGEKNYMCKHLLAAVISHQTGKTVKSEVEIGGVAELLGLLDISIDGATALPRG